MRRLASGLIASAIAVALVTAAIALFKPYVPVLSLGVLYVFAVLPIAIAYGLPLAIVVSVASLLAFEWFYLPPVHHFSLRNNQNWFALAVYLVTAIVVSELAARSRRRAAAAERREYESALLAQLATDLLRGRSLDEELPAIAGRAAEVLGVPSTEIVLGEPRRPPKNQAPYPLEAAGRSGSGRRRTSTGSSRRRRPPGREGFSAKELAWLLTNAPTETLVLRPAA
jgi:K+-sensing histidine kinase KdpD